MYNHPKSLTGFLQLALTGIICCCLYTAQAQVSPLEEEQNKDLKDYFLTLRQLLSKQEDLLGNSTTFEESGIIQNTLIGTSAGIQQLHKSGYVIFSGPAVDYLNHLKDYLLKDYSRI